MKAPSLFSAAMIAVFALSSCTKENREDLAPLGGKVAVPAAIQDQSTLEAHNALDHKAGAQQTAIAQENALRAGQDRKGLSAVAILAQEREGKSNLDIQQDVGRVEFDRQAAGQSHIGREDVMVRPEVVPVNTSRPVLSEGGQSLGIAGGQAAIGRQKPQDAATQ